jgi:antitoxin component YwqK of YwqJK toxin-antitoxin module
MRLFVALILFASITSCLRHAERVAAFIFDEGQVSSKETYRYEFDENGRIKTVAVNNFFQAGGLSDSSTYVDHYTYNASGKIERIFHSGDSSCQYKFYDEADSLVAEYNINRNGDTTVWRNWKYADGKMTRWYDVTLHPALPENPEDFNLQKLKDMLERYDTSVFIVEFIYEKGIQVKSLEYDKSGLVSGETEFVYENGRKAQTMNYSISGGNRFLSQTTYYEERDGRSYETTIGFSGDTLSTEVTFFQDEKKIVIHDSKITGQSIMYFDAKDQIIGHVVTDPIDGTKHVTATRYDEKGNVVERARYSMQ